MSQLEYNLAHLDKTLIQAAASKALIAADSDYFSWTPKDQERFRATLSDDVMRRVRCVLLESLCDIRCSREGVDNAWNDVPRSQVNSLNWALLLVTGIGVDNIYLNEHLADGKSLLDFSSLYDYDYADYLYQEAARKRDFRDYDGIDYFAWQHPSWVRLLIDGQFFYATFTSLATFALDEVKSFGDEAIRQMIPHEYVDGKNHGKRESGGFLWDMKIDAAGQEAQLDELNSRFFNYQYDRWLSLSEECAGLAAAVHVHDENWDDDPHRTFIFANEETLKRIRWRHFSTDCKPLIADFSAVEALLAEETARSNTWLTENHRDIQDNFDPKVVKMRRKRKIIVSANALDDLSEIGRDDE